MLNACGAGKVLPSLHWLCSIRTCRITASELGCVIKNLTKDKVSKQIEPDRYLLPAVNCGQRFSHAKNVGKVDSKILHFKEVHCILLVVFLRTGEEETGLLSLDILLEVEVEGVLEVGEDGEVGVLAQVEDDCCAKQEHRVSIPPSDEIEFVRSRFGTSLTNQI